MEKGELTIFFSLIMTVLISFVVVCIEGAKDAVIRMEIQSVVDMGLDSIFAEYHKELLNQYDLFYIDSSYGTKTPSYETTKEHLIDYMNSNFQPEIEKGGIGFMNFRNIIVEKVDFINIELATDNRGSSFVDQGIEVMKARKGITDTYELINEIDEEIGSIEEAASQVEKFQLFDTDIQKERQQVSNDIKRSANELSQENNIIWNKVSQETGIDIINKNYTRGILNQVLEEEDTISNITISKEGLLSNREVNVGVPKMENIEPRRWDEKHLFNQYLKTFFNDYTKGEDRDALQYEIEYILEGTTSDVDNLKGVVHKLILLRSASNMLYLSSDTGKVAEVDGIAWSIAIATVSPQLQPAIKQGLLLTWAYLEGIEDVKILLHQGKVPFVKKAKDWNLSLSNILFRQFQPNNQKENKEGLSYSDYLQLLLLYEEEETKTKRAMDLVELNIRSTKGNGNFRFDGCIVEIKVIAFLSSGFGYDYDIVRSFKYS